MKKNKIKVKSTCILDKSRITNELVYIQLGILLAKHRC